MCVLRYCDIESTVIHVNQVTYTLHVGERVNRIATSPKTMAGKRLIPLNDKLHPCWTNSGKRNSWNVYAPVRCGRAANLARGNNGFFHGNRLARRQTQYSADTARKPETGWEESRGVHTLRHTFATMWVQSGYDLRTLSEILGHTNVAFTIQRHVHSDTATKQRGMEALQA